MSGTTEKFTTIGGMSATSNEMAIGRKELVGCEKCGRLGPPTRSHCLYCGAPLEFAEERTSAVQPDLTPPQPGEDGFSIVLSANTNGDYNVAKVCELTGSDEQTIRSLVSCGGAVPVCFLKTLQDAHIVATRLTEAGIGCSIAGDDLLMPQVQPTRLRSISFGQDGITLVEFNSGSEVKVASAEKLVLVSGLITKVSSHSDSKRKRGRSVASSEQEIFDDEAVIDIYTVTDVLGFRARPSGFDFSGLGDRMQMTSAANLKVLEYILLERHAGSVVIDGYRKAMHALDAVWPRAHSFDGKGASRGAFGGIRLSKTTVIENSLQFTRFSRLQRHFL